MVPQTNYIRCLGVTLDSKLNLNWHVENVTAKGNSTLGFYSEKNILTNFEAVKNMAYKQLVLLVCVYAVFSIKQALVLMDDTSSPSFCDDDDNNC